MPSERRVVALCLSIAAAFAPLGIAAAAEPAPMSSGAPSTVVAKQGTAIVTLADIDAFAARMPEKERHGFFDNPTRLESLITTMLMQKQLAEEARKINLDKDPAVRQQIDYAADEVLSRARMDRFRSDLKIPDFGELANEEYVGHKEKYVIPGELSVQQILISTSSRSADEAKAIADTVDAEAKAHPDRFDALVQKYSDDPAKGTSGLIAGVTADKYVPPFVAAAKALKKPGDISPPVKTKYGFHIIKLVSHMPDRQQTFAESRAKIVDQLKADFIDKSVHTHTDEIRNQKIDANPELVASLRTRYGSDDSKTSMPGDSAPVDAKP